MIKTLMGCIREYKKPSILTPIYVSVEVIVECIIPFFIAKLINHIEDGSETRLVLLYGAALIGLAFISLFFGALAGAFAGSFLAGLLFLMLLN